MKSAEISTTGMGPVRARAIERLRRLVLDTIGGRDVAVYLFGSMATGRLRHASDIDVAILPRQELPPAFFAKLAERIEESTIPYDVDIIDLRDVSPSFREDVIKTGVKWRD